MLLTAPVRTPCASGSSSIARLRPSRPPTPISVKPKPSWKPGLNSAVMMISSEKPGVPSGQLRVDQADRLERQEVGDRQLERAGVLALVEVEEEVAAALDDAGVDGEADAVRRLEAEREVGRAEVALAVGGKVNVAVSPMFSTTALSTDRSPLMVAASSTGCRRRLNLTRDQRRHDLDRPELDVRGDGDLEAAAAAEVEPLGGREADGEVGADGQALRPAAAWRGSRRCPRRGLMTSLRALRRRTR